MKQELSLKEFINLERSEISRIIKQKKRPQNVCIMLDGTRRLLKLKSGYHDDSWLYYKDHVQSLIHKSMETTDLLFDMGIKFVVGPLVSFGNLHRKNFIPKGLRRLLDPLLEEHSLSVLNKHNASLSFYGDIEYARSMPGGEIIKKYQEKFEKINPLRPKKRILIGIGFSTDREVKLISDMAIDYYKVKKVKPSFNLLVKEYFGFNIAPIDMFIRSNEVRASGGLTPLLVSRGTQFYFPVSPGIISFSEEAIKAILYDYLYNRVISKGGHEHEAVTPDQAKKVGEFYFKSKSEIIGVGRRVGDMWIHESNNN